MPHAYTYLTPNFITIVLITSHHCQPTLSLNKQQGLWELSILAHSSLNLSRKSWYSLGMELRSTDASEVTEQAFAVTLKRASWKISVPSILHIQANAAHQWGKFWVLQASEFFLEEQWSGLPERWRPTRAEMLMMSSAHAGLFQMKYYPVPNQLTDCSRWADCVLIQWSSSSQVE